MKPTESHFAWTALEQAYIERQQGEVLPCWFITLEDGTSHVIGTPFSEDYDSKLAIADYIALHAVEFKATEILFVTDVWMRSLPPGTPKSETHKKVSRQLDAVEAIIVNVWNREHTGFTLIRSYRKRDDGTLEILEEIVNETEAEPDTFAAVTDALQFLAENPDC